MPAAPCTSGSTINAATSPLDNIFATRPTLRCALARRRGDEGDVEQFIVKRFGEQSTAAGGHRAEGIAVVAIGQCHDGAARLSASW